MAHEDLSGKLDEGTLRSAMAKLKLKLFRICGLELRCPWSYYFCSQKWLELAKSYEILSWLALSLSSNTRPLSTAA